MYQNVNKITSLNNVVDRIETDSQFILDVYKPFFQCKEGDSIKISISYEPQNEADYLTYGVVYYSDTNSCCISSGGLLSSIPFTHPMHKSVYIAMQKSKKKKNNIAEHRSITRQKKN